MHFCVQDQRDRAEVLRRRRGRLRDEAKPRPVGGRPGGHFAGRPGQLLQQRPGRRGCQEKVKRARDALFPMAPIFRFLAHFFFLMTEIIFQISQQTRP